MICLRTNAQSHNPLSNSNFYEKRQINEQRSTNFKICPLYKEKQNSKMCDYCKTPCKGNVKSPWNLF